MYRHLTLHVVNSIPWSNLNRDDTGTPKRLNQGGVLRGQLSSQSIKRAARTDYEEQSMDRSFRSGNLAALVTKRALELRPEADEKAMVKAAVQLIGRLTKESATEGGSDRSAWLSTEELEAAAQRISSGNDDEFIEGHKTGSLAIAAFGRMFANDPTKGTEAALSVSPAVATHRTVIENDYFSTVDDYGKEDHGAGATFLGISQYLNGVFYRTVTIDREQLKESWTGTTGEHARTNLGLLLTSLIYKLPRGKRHGTAPYVMPALVLCEEQAYRLAYDFETPVQAGNDGGYLGATIQRLIDQRAACLRFDPDNYGELSMVTGTADGLSGFGLPLTTRQGMVDAIADWTLS